ncbi:putative phage tail protein [Paenibacillus alba]|uniref:DUF2313 domain-containing protein n=1 Tax=Paenibacillus alba TaxID=1197127 RepID=A0ABU6GF26_9BACL|nr:putative phage tail protein [Paenibacillus alba]MEC0231279.1 DUF2313 domain-containing protein [Paenibacillus alba]
MAFLDFFKNILPISFLSNSFQNSTGMYKSLARQFDDLKAAILDGCDQLFIDTATWSLPIYEAEFAIQLVDQSNTAARRNNVMAMSRGGLGATPAAIKSILQAYGYSTNIVESFGTYTVTIQFVDTRGIPSNINDLQALMYRFIPGHLNLTWQFIYTIHYELEPFTHAQMEGRTYAYYETQLPT